MTISVAYISQVTVVETIGGAYVSPGDNTVTSLMTTTASLASGTTPPATKYSLGALTMSSGAGTIDLTSLPNSDGVAATVTLTGLRLASVKLRNKSTNANAITIAKGASNGCTALGSAFSITLQVGEEMTVLAQNLATAVGSGARTFDVSGTGSQVLEYEFVAG